MENPLELIIEFLKGGCKVRDIDAFFGKFFGLSRNQIGIYIIPSSMSEDIIYFCDRAQRLCFSYDNQGNPIYVYGPIAKSDRMNNFLCYAISLKNNFMRYVPNTKITITPSLKSDEIVELTFVTSKITELNKIKTFFNTNFALNSDHVVRDDGFYDITYSIQHSECQCIMNYFNEDKDSQRSRCKKMY